MTAPRRHARRTFITPHTPGTPSEKELSPRRHPSCNPRTRSQAFTPACGPRAAPRADDIMVNIHVCASASTACLRVLVSDPLVVVGHVLRGAVPVPVLFCCTTSGEKQGADQFQLRNFTIDHRGESESAKGRAPTRFGVGTPFPKRAVLDRRRLQARA